MTKRFKLPILLLLITAFAVVVLASCTSVGIAAVQVKEGATYKTEYVIGEELDLAGIELVVTRTDGEAYTVFATEVRQDLKVLNFKTDKVIKDLSVILEYKGVATSILINVSAKEDAATKYVVTFDTGEGSEIEPLGAGEYETITAPADPVRDGYVFDGWYKQTTYNDLWNFNVDKVVSDTTLYAKWAKLYSVIFRDEYNGNPDIIKYVKEGDTLSDVPAVPTVDGMEGSWSRESFTNVHANIVVNSVYVPATYDVTFYYMDSDGITPIILKVFEDVVHGTNLATEKAQEIAAIPVPEQSVDGTKHFDRWSQSFDYIVSDLSICALYVTNTYDVTFSLNYDTESSEYHKVEDVTYNNPVSRPSADPVREGYAFDGWYKQTECSTVWNFNTDRVKGNTVIYAKWTKLYNVRFIVAMDVTLDEEITETVDIVVNGNPVTYKLYGVVQVREGGNADKLALPSKTGYTARWLIEDRALQNLSSDVNVEAAFDINKYEVTFYNYDRSIIKVYNPSTLKDENSQYVEYLSSAVAPSVTPERYGYDFIGWDTDFSSVTRDLEVTALFEASTYQVGIVPNNGAQPYSIEATFDSRIELPSLQYTNYYFAGWYTDSIFAEEWSVSSDALKVAGDGALTLYAKWLKIHTVVFYDDHTVQVASEKVVDGNTVASVPTIASKEGETGNWYVRGTDSMIASTPFDFETAITADTTFVLQYAVNEYTVNFYIDIGQLHLTLKVSHGGTVVDKINVPDPEVTGKNFIRWDKNLDYVIVADTDFMAEFEPKIYTVTWGVGSSITSKVEHGKPAVFPAGAEAPTREGYNLQGWEPTDEKQSIESVVGDMVVTPLWTIKTFSVEFKDRETNDVYMQTVGQAQVTSQTKEYGQFIDVDSTVPNPEKVGKDFIGWEVGSLRLRYDNDAATWILDNPNGGANLTYVFNSGVVSLVVYGDELYYTFENVDSVLGMISSNWDTTKLHLITPSESGWITSSGLLTDYTSLSFNGRFFYAIEDNTVFYSNHVISTYTVDYVTGVEGMTVPQEIKEYGALSVAPELENRDNFVFLGWYTDTAFENKYTFGTPVTGDLILYARWESSREGTDGLVYSLNESGTAYSLTAIGADFDKSIEEVVVANYYNGLPVDSIGAEAFADISLNGNIRKLDLPNTLVNIGPGAFMNMTALEEIYIPESVSIIPDNAFNGATALSTVSFGAGSSLTTIGKNAFAKNTSLKHSAVDGVKTIFTLPESVTSIESGAFYNCTSFTEIYIPASVLSIGDNAFAGANNLRYAVFSKNTPANLGANVFQNYTSLQKAFRIYVPNVALYTGSAANANWQLLKDKIYDVANVSSDGEWAYTLATNGTAVLVQYLGVNTEISIPLTVSVGFGNIDVSEIGDYAFDGAVTSVSFNASIAINENSFGSADSLKNLTITVGATNAINSSYLYGAYSSVASLDTLTVSPTTTVSELFGGSAPTALTTVKTLAGANSNIAQGFLANCVYVQNVVINGRAETIGANAFLNCTALTKVIFDNSNSASLKTIGASAFSGAISLESFEVLDGEGAYTAGLPSSVTTIGANAFDGTKWLSANSGDMVIVGNGILYRYRGQESVIAIPASVTAITASAFSGNTAIKQVYVENIEASLLTTVGESAFANCVNLESVILPASLTKLEASVFSGSVKLASVVFFGDNAASLGANAFANVHSEAVFYIPDGASQSYVADWTTMYTYQEVSGLTLYVGNSEDEKWVYGDALGGEGVRLIKSLGAGTSLTVPERINGKDVYEIANYALSRGLDSLSYSTFILNNGDKAFGGVTSLSDLTLYNSFNNHRVEASALMSLFTQNENIEVLNTTSTRSLNALIGGILPTNVKKVNVLEGETLIADSFLEGNSGVEEITVTVGGSTYKLEDTASLTEAHGFTSVGAKAFRGTAWMDAYDGEYVIVLSGNLVDYKGVNSVLDIPDGVVEINGSIFENDSFIEVVYIPASVTRIGDFAFNGTSKLTKVFVEATTVPTIYADSFDSSLINEAGMEIFVPASALSAYQSVGSWSGLNPQGDSGIVHFRNELSSRLNAAEKSVSYAEYIVSTSGKLLLSRGYTETYSLSSGTETLVNITENTSATAPASVTDSSSGATYNITSLGNNVFMSSVSDISIGLGLSINDYTFKNVGELSTVTVTDVDLDNRGISGTALINIFNAHSVRTIAYDGSVTLSALLGTSDTGALSTLSGVKITDGTRTTVAEMLAGWSTIDSVVFPASIESVGINSLEDTAWFKNYTSTVYGNDFVVLGGLLLYKYKGSSTTIVIPNEVEIVNTGAFSSYNGAEWSSSLRVNQVRFESGSTAHTILDYAFSGCGLLNSITLPNSMISIAPSAFDNTGFVVENDMLIVAGDASSGATLVKYYGTATEFIIPSNVKKIASGAFAGNTTLTSVSYDGGQGGSILSIVCEDAFNGATALTSVTLPSTVVSVGKNAFYNTPWLGNQINSGSDVMIGTTILYQRVTTGATFTLNAGITSVTEDALVALPAFTIGGTTYQMSDSVTATALVMNNGAYLPQAELYSILSKEWMTSLRTSGQVALSSLIGSSEPLPNITSLSFLPGATEIASGYAYGWENVRSVTNIPSTVTKIGAHAFEGTAWYDNLSGTSFIYAGESGVIIKYNGVAENLVIGANASTPVTGITADAFRGNEKLKSVRFASYAKLTEIPAEAFKDCVNLETVTLNDNIVSFGENAFENTAWLNNYDSDYLVIGGTMIAYKGEGGAITIPEGTRKIYSYVFSGNESITSVTFDKNCLMSAIEANTFRDCVNLEELVLNEYITRVERSALEGTLWLSQTSQAANPVLYYENSYYGVKRAVLYVGTASTYRVPGDITEIMPTAFSGVTTLSQLVFVEGKLTAIPDGAFEGCTSLSSVTLVSTITEIGENAFAGTPWLTAQSAEFVVANGVLIKYNGTSSAVVLPSTVSAIERGVFDGSSITSIDMSATAITEIPAGAFRSLSTLVSVIYSGSTVYVGEGAFSGTAYLANATDEFLLANGVALIAYNGEGGVVTLPEGVRYLNADVFGGNQAVKGVVIQSEIEIAPSAFVGTSLATLTGEEYIVSIGAGAFSGTDYELNRTAGDFTVVGGYLVKYQGTSTEVVIPAEVTYIPEGVFTDNEVITSVDFSAVTGLLTIEANAFRNALSLEEIVFSDNIDYIGNRAFYNTAWQNATDSELIISPSGKLLAYIAEGSIVNIPATVVSFARDVFKGNANVTTVQFAQGASVDIPAEAFKDCTALLNVTFPRVAFSVGANAFENTAWLRRQSDYVVVNGMLIAYKGSSTDIVIPATVTSIYDYVFKGNEAITSLSFASGSGLTAITGEAFVGCVSLQSVSFRSTLETLDMGAFEGTAWKNALTSDFVIVGDKLLAYVGEGGDVVIPGEVLTIAQNAFRGNTAITSLSFAMGSYLTTIPAGAFEGCVNLQSVTFPEDIASVGKDAFKGTKWLEDHLASVEGTEEEGCYILGGTLLFYVGTAKELWLPSTITSISATAFDGASVVSLVVSSTEPADVTLEEGALDGINAIYVDDAVLDSYRTATGWSSYALKIKSFSEIA